jgi:hypothetical protein
LAHSFRGFSPWSASFIAVGLLREAEYQGCRVSGGRRDCSSLGRQEAEKETDRKGSGTRHHPQGPTTSDLLPPARHHFLIAH